MSFVILHDIMLLFNLFWCQPKKSTWAFLGWISSDKFLFLFVCIGESLSPFYFWRTVLSSIEFFIVILFFLFLWWLGKLLKYILYTTDSTFCIITSTKDCCCTLISLQSFFITYYCFSLLSCCFSMLFSFLYES